MILRTSFCSFGVLRWWLLLNDWGNLNGDEQVLGDERIRMCERPDVHPSASKPAQFKQLPRVKRRYHCDRALIDSKELATKKWFKSLPLAGNIRLGTEQWHELTRILLPFESLCSVLSNLLILLNSSRFALLGSVI